MVYIAISSCAPPCAGPGPGACTIGGFWWIALLFALIACCCPIPPNTFSACTDALPPLNSSFFIQLRRVNTAELLCLLLTDRLRRFCFRMDLLCLRMLLRLRVLLCLRVDDLDLLIIYYSHILFCFNHSHIFVRLAQSSIFSTTNTGLLKRGQIKIYYKSKSPTNIHIFHCKRSHPAV